jgi:hypothetical protein
MRYSIEGGDFLEHELFHSLRVAGIDGRIKCVLSERTLLLERRDGKGMRIDLDAIHRLRHHHVAITPPLVTLIGIISLLAGARVLDGRVQLYAFGLGAFALLIWVLGRRPALSIDTRQGDRHILYGRDHKLQRLYIMLDRMADGATLDQARLGLDELIEPNYPTIGRIEDFQKRIEAVAASEAALAEFEEPAEVDTLESALARLSDKRRRALGDEPVHEAELLSDDEVHLEASAPQPVMNDAHPVFERATVALRDQRATQTSEPIPHSSTQRADGYNAVTGSGDYQVPWQIGQGGSSSSPSSTDSPSHGSTLLDRSLSEARNAGQEAGFSFEQNEFGGGGMFAEGGLFDTLDQAEGNSGPESFSSNPAPTASATSSYPSQSFQPAVGAHAPSAPHPSAWRNEPVEATSYAMITSASPHLSGLPEPNRDALRPECTPGVVAVAKLAEGEYRPPKVPGDGTQGRHAPLGDPLEEYPTLQRMRATRPEFERLRLKPATRRPSERSAFASIRAWVSPRLKQIGNSGRKMGRILRRDPADGYRDTYGDDDGFDDDEPRDAELVSTQLLRLRADQDAQADISERLDLLTRSGGGRIADDLAADILRSLSTGDEVDIQKLLDEQKQPRPEAPSSFVSLRSTTGVSEADKLSFAGLQRLG